MYIHTRRTLFFFSYKIQFRHTLFMLDNKRDFQSLLFFVLGWTLFNGVWNRFDGSLPIFVIMVQGPYDLEWLSLFRWPIIRNTNHNNRILLCSVIKIERTFHTLKWNLCIWMVDGNLFFENTISVGTISVGASITKFRRTHLKWCVCVFFKAKKCNLAQQMLSKSFFWYVC